MLRITIVLTLGLFLCGMALADDCHPPLKAGWQQYIVGYGSLMEAKSKQMTEPNAGESRPVQVTGFRREWNLHGTFPTTFLGVREDASAQMVAVLYRAELIEGKIGADAREFSYCRAPVDADSVSTLDGSELPAQSQIWIYVNKPEFLSSPNAKHPIVQSYVDIFITGCLEMQERVTESGFNFVDQCILTTSGWSKHWVNDRLYPRRPFMYQKRVLEIDEPLKRLLPEYFEAIKIE